MELELEDQPNSFEFSTQAPPQKVEYKNYNALDFSVPSKEREIALQMAQRHAVPYEVVVCALYATSGNVSEANKIIANPSHSSMVWLAEDDMILLQHQRDSSTLGYRYLVQTKGIEAVNKRLRFLESFISKPDI